MKFHPHLHILTNHDINFNYKFNKLWRKIILNNLRIASNQYYYGYYVWSDSIQSKNIAKYIGRYVRHPVIANSRIDFFDKAKMLVGFHYEDHEKIRHDVVMNSDDFISALIGHIPPPQFKMIRYYGAYARRSRKKYKKHMQSSIEQTKLMVFGVELPERILKCPFCDGELEFVCYLKKPPPEIMKTQKELLDFVK